MSAPINEGAWELDSHEDAPLIGDDASSTASTPAEPKGSGSESESNKSWRWDIVVICALMIFFVEVGVYLTVPARHKIMEENICRGLHPELADQAILEDASCRDPEVQGKIAMLNGWTFTFECIPGLLTAIPYGVAADRFGRKPILALALFGYLLTILWVTIVLALPTVLPIELYFLNPIFLFIGGGLMEPVFYTMGADVVPSEKMAVVYLQIGAVIYAGELVGAQAGGFLTDKDPWLSMLLGFGIATMASLGVFALPETMHLRKTDAAADVEPPGLGLDGSHDNSRVRMRDHKVKTLLREGLGLMKSRMREAVAFMRSNSHLMLLLLGLVFSLAGKYVQNLLMQYAAKRYDISWGQASELVSLRSVFVMVWQLAVLPIASRMVVKRFRLTPVVRDLWMARVAVFGLSAGALLVAFAVSPALLAFALVVLSFGLSFPLVVRSVLNALVDDKLAGTLNATIALCERIGVMLLSPIMSSLLKLGMERGGGWIGLPFMFATGVFSVSAVIIWIFRLRPKERP